MNILERIIAAKQREVASLKAGKSFESIHDEALACGRPVISLRSALLASPTGIIAEFKRKSPSRGFIHEKADAAEVTAGYRRAGATAVSVLTDREFFGGSLDDLCAARANLDIPILRKDFVIDPYQICEARLAGADAILLIASALTSAQSASLARFAHGLGLEVLLELHHESELAHIGDCVDVAGVNNRNLSTFVTDVDRSLVLAEKIPPGTVRISESGISSPETVLRLRRAGFRGFLMGENFMKESDPAEALGMFIGQLSI